MESTTDDILFTLGPESIELPKAGWKPEIAWAMADKDKWANFTNETTYIMDKAMREFCEEMSHHTSWTKHAKNRRYRFKDLFEICYGEPYDMHKHSHMTNAARKVFAYYSTRTLKETTINEKRAKNVFCLSTTAWEKKPPYSLRLRFEQANGKPLPARYKMLPKDDLKIYGDARNPRTKENMKKRKERANEARAKYLADWRKRTGRHGEKDIHSEQ